MHLFKILIIQFLFCRGALFHLPIILLWKYLPFTLVADSASSSILFTGSSLPVGELLLAGPRALLAWPHVFTRLHIISTPPHAPFSAGLHSFAMMRVFAVLYVPLFPGGTLHLFLALWTLAYLLCNLKLSSRCLRCRRAFWISCCFWFSMLFFMFADGTASELEGVFQ